MSGPTLTTLARDVSAGSDRIFIHSRAAEMHHLTIEPGTPNEERLLVQDCRGFWPHLVLLGYGNNCPPRVRRTHAAGTVVRIESVGPELAAARQQAVAGLCWHPKAVPVDTADGETVAALCPDCDAQLPGAWLTPDEPPALP